MYRAISECHIVVAVSALIVAAARSFFSVQPAPPPTRDLLQEKRLGRRIPLRVFQSEQKQEQHSVQTDSLPDAQLPFLLSEPLPPLQPGPAVVQLCRKPFPLER